MITNKKRRKKIWSSSLIKLCSNSIKSILTIYKKKKIIKTRIFQKSLNKITFKIYKKKKNRINS
jgi:hypothetical protein